MGDDAPKDTSGVAAHAAVHALFRHVSGPYGQRYLALTHLRDLFQQELALCLQPSLNLWIREQQPVSAEHKGSFAASITRDLSSLGLAISSPFGPDPSRLSVRNSASSTHFAFESLEHGPRRSDATFDQVPDLTLINDLPRSQALLLRLTKPNGKTR